MSIMETFSKRKKRLERAGQQDIYQYDVLTEPFRVQVIHIWNSTIGVFYRASGYSTLRESPTNKFWELIHDTHKRKPHEPRSGSKFGNH